jgi:D-beta-D-heptose 7-phosphate kinase/D-beta-D-heptose 1-phosphate adenosyltransferase
LSFVATQCPERYGVEMDSIRPGALVGATYQQKPPGDPALVAAVKRLSRTSLLVIGDVMLDRYIYGHVTRISSEAPVPILAVEREVALPGGAGNVVRNLTALGAAIAFVSVVGDDQSGSDLTGLIGGQPGVEPWLLVQGGRVTTRKTRFVAKGQQILRTDREESGPIHKKLAERMVRIAFDAMAATSVTLMSDYGKGVLSNDVPAQLIAAARRAGRKVIVEPRGTDYARYAGADIIMPTWTELAEVTGQPAATDSDVATAAEALRERFGFKAVLVLRAEAGMTLLDADGVQHYPAELAEIFDLAGVRDCVAATLSAGIAAGLGNRVSAQLAAIAAGLASGKVGTGVVQDLDLLAAIGGA